MCEEYSPTGRQAIVLEEKDVIIDGEMRRLKSPKVMDKLCIGCGICETKIQVRAVAREQTSSQVPMVEWQL